MVIVTAMTQMDRVIPVGVVNEQLFLLRGFLKSVKVAPCQYMITKQHAHECHILRESNAGKSGKLKLK